MLDAVIMALEVRMYILLDKCMESLGRHWENSSTGFNPGQYFIYSNYLVIPLMEWMEYAVIDWPWVASEDYVDAMFSGYDMDVLDRAFSDTIYDPTGKMDEMIYQAQEIAYKIEMLQALSLG